MTPELVAAFADAVLRIGLPAVGVVGGIWLIGKLLDCLKAKWSK